MKNVNQSESFHSIYIDTEALCCTPKKLVCQFSLSFFKKMKEKEKKGGGDGTAA